jgi:hypothetical protein
MFSAQAHSLKAFVFARAGHFFFIFAYLWLLLSVYALHNSIVLSDWRLLGHLGPAMLKALVFTKFVLIGEHLKLGARFEKRPLRLPFVQVDNGDSAEEVPAIAFRSTSRLTNHARNSTMNSAAMRPPQAMTIMMRSAVQPAPSSVPAISGPTI